MALGEPVRGREVKGKKQEYWLSTGMAGSTAVSEPIGGRWR
jgi:hypothetical protein